MKCTNKLYKIITIILLASILCGCGQSTIWMPFSDYTKTIRSTNGRSNIIEHSDYDDRTPGFSAKLCVFSGDVSYNDYSTISSTASLLIDARKQEVIYSNNAFEQRYPASLTKLMTAYVAVKYLSLDTIINCTQSVETIDVPGAVLLGLHEGDYFTLDQALHLCLLSSYNDVALAIAEAVSGTVEDFSKLMNEEALKLGCTQTHFIDPSGLSSGDHYTSGYDLYLIFNAVISNPDILEVMQCKEYTTMIHSKNGAEREASSVNTNRFFHGMFSVPSNITVVGGKTGTTDEAGHCLIMLVKDTSSNPYIALVMGAKSTDDLYNEMSQMLNLCEITPN